MTYSFRVVLFDYETGEVTKVIRSEFTGDREDLDQYIEDKFIGDSDLDYDLEIIDIW